MWENYGERRMGRLWGGVVPSLPLWGCTSPHRVWSLGTREGAMPLPRKCKLHAEKVKFGANFCVLLLFKREIIVDSKLPGDLVRVPGAEKLTPVSGILLGIPGDLRPCVRKLFIIASVLS